MNKDMINALRAPAGRHDDDAFRKLGKENQDNDHAIGRSMGGSQS